MWSGHTLAAMSFSLIRCLMDWSERLELGVSRTLSDWLAVSGGLSEWLEVCGVLSDWLELSGGLFDWLELGRGAGPTNTTHKAKSK